MSENLKKFLELVASNKELEAKVMACNDLSADEAKAAMIRLAKENGIELTVSDFEKKAAPANCELNDDELDAVAGGACACPLAGVGGGKDANDGKTYHCACTSYGQGGDGRAKDSNCWCVFVGDGQDSWQFYN